MKYQVGGLVLVKLLPQQFKSWRKVHKRLVRKYEGPFKITKRILKVSYQWELPSWLKIHSVFHASCLKLYHEDMEDPSRGLSNRAPTAVVDSCDKEAEYIIADRTVRTSWRASLHRVFGQVEALGWRAYNTPLPRLLRLQKWKGFVSLFTEITCSKRAYPNRTFFPCLQGARTNYWIGHSGALLQWFNHIPIQLYFVFSKASQERTRSKME